MQEQNAGIRKTPTSKTVKVLLFLAVVLIIAAIGGFAMGTQTWGYAVISDTTGISLAIAALVEYRFAEVKTLLQAEHHPK